MPYTVAVSFDKFIENISLTGDHTGTAEARRKRIVSLLENTFEIVDSFPTGSIPKKTAIKTHADLDIFVVLHYGKHIKGKTPTQVLQSVRDALAEYRTGVRKNGQAVTLYYESWPNVDIVPVSRVTNDDGSTSHYNVPDMNTGRWLPSRPRNYAAALDLRAATLGDGFRPLLRMMKQWNVEHSELMESYHIEVIGLKASLSSITDYSWSSFAYFDQAAKLAASSLAYDGGYADDYLDAASRREVLKRLETARDKAREAWSCTYGGSTDHQRAIAIWRQVFGSKFPAYG